MSCPANQELVRPLGRPLLRMLPRQSQQPTASWFAPSWDGGDAGRLAFQALFEHLRTWRSLMLALEKRHLLK